MTQCLFSRSTNSFQYPPLCSSISSPTCFLKCNTNDWLMPTKVEILWVETWLLSCTKAWCFYSWVNGGIWLRMIPHLTYYGTKATQCTKISQRSQLHNAHRDLDVGRVATNKSIFCNPNHFDISYFRNHEP